MSNKEIIEQLEGLRSHCSSMIDKEDPESPWRADVEALNEAIKVMAGLNINKNQNGGINTMSDKTKVTIKHPDGHRQEVTADTVLCFTVDRGAEFLGGKAKIIDAKEIFIGRDIPEPIFAQTIGSLLSSFVEARQKENPMMAAFNLHRISQILEAKSKDMTSGTTQQQKEEALHGAVEDLLKVLLSR